MRPLVLFAAVLDVGVLRRVVRAYVRRAPRHWPASVELHVPVIEGAGLPGRLQG
ncbi:MAG TPA: hypothetical protein VJ804_16145 [Acidimicrobiales bacterium]|nr:hypothetical protein [Acidimicrobiales bacterium]